MTHSFPTRRSSDLEKMKPAGYRDIAAADVPTVQLAGGVEVRVIAGTLHDGDRRIDGPVNPQAARRSTDPLYFDVHLPANARFEHALDDARTAFVYVYDGEATIAGQQIGRASWRERVWQYG